MAKQTDAFDHERTLAVLERARKQELSSDSLRKLTWKAYESIHTAANEEIRQLLATLKNRLQLSLIETDPPRSPLTRAEVWELLNTIQNGERALDAQLPREEIARSFLSIDPTPTELAGCIHEHLQRRDYGESVEVSLEPVPVEVDPHRFGQALLVLVDTFHERSDGQQPVLRVKWKGSKAGVFVGARPPVEPRHKLQRWLDRGASLKESGLDVPLALSVFRCLDGDVSVYETEDGAVGFRAIFPALDDKGLFEV